MSTAVTELLRDLRDLRARVAELEGAPRPAEPAYQRILHLVGQDFGVPVALIASACRRKDIAMSRHVAFCVGQRGLGYSLPRIGRLAGRDHTTVLHGIRRVEAMAEADPDFAARVTALIDQITFERSRA
jgi:chromosomal replication initiation ATPase DnaA